MDAWIPSNPESAFVDEEDKPSQEQLRIAQAVSIPFNRVHENPSWIRGLTPSRPSFTGLVFQAQE
jgi:hypothetical protein